MHAARGSRDTSRHTALETALRHGSQQGSPGEKQKAQHLAKAPVGSGVAQTPECHSLQVRTAMRAQMADSVIGCVQLYNLQSIRFNERVSTAVQQATDGLAQTPVTCPWVHQRLGRVTSGARGALQSDLPARRCHWERLGASLTLACPRIGSEPHHRPNGFHPPSIVFHPLRSQISCDLLAGCAAAGGSLLRSAALDGESRVGASARLLRPGRKEAGNVSISRDCSVDMSSDGKTPSADLEGGPGRVGSKESGCGLGSGRRGGEVCP